MFDVSAAAATVEGLGMTQADALLDLLRERGEAGVTPLLALDRLGIFRLAARVADLRAAGHDVVTERITTASGANVARYVLDEPVPVPPIAAGQVELGL